MDTIKTETLLDISYDLLMTRLTPNSYLGRALPYMVGLLINILFFLLMFLCLHFSDHLPQPSDYNNTKLIVFNTIPKCGSTTVREVLRLQSRNKFQVISQAVSVSDQLQVSFILFNIFGVTVQSWSNVSKEILLFSVFSFKSNTPTLILRDSHCSYQYSIFLTRQSWSAVTEEPHLEFSNKLIYFDISYNSSYKDPTLSIQYEHKTPGSYAGLLIEIHRTWHWVLTLNLQTWPAVLRYTCMLCQSRAQAHAPILLAHFHAVWNALFAITCTWNSRSGVKSRVFNP